MSLRKLVVFDGGNRSGEVIEENGQFFTIRPFDSVCLIGGGVEWPSDEVMEVLRDDCEIFLSFDACLRCVIRRLEQRGIKTQRSER